LADILERLFRDHIKEGDGKPQSPLPFHQLEPEGDTTKPLIIASHKKSDFPRIR
jgi:hypothetical protein